MKRRSISANVGKGEWPSLRPDTLKAIVAELIRARKKHPKNSASLKMAENYLVELRDTFILYEQGKSSATQIYAVAATVAAMAIRCMEEGSGGSKYRGNTQAPEFILTPADGHETDEPGYAGDRER